MKRKCTRTRWSPEAKKIVRDTFQDYVTKVTDQQPSLVDVRAMMAGHENHFVGRTPGGVKIWIVQNREHLNDPKFFK